MHLDSDNVSAVARWVDEVYPSDVTASQRPDDHLDDVEAPSLWLNTVLMDILKRG
jgi:hypothetical protein